MKQMERELALRNRALDKTKEQERDLYEQVRNTSLS
jgi:hypothetical protein